MCADMAMCEFQMAVGMSDRVDQFDNRAELKVGLFYIANTSSVSCDWICFVVKTSLLVS